MQCKSNVRSYVFRSILLPYFTPTQCVFSTSTLGSGKGTSTYTARFHSNGSSCSARQSSTSSRAARHSLPSPQSTTCRTISSIQQVRGHDPPTLPNTPGRQTVAQRRTREYLGILDDASHIKRREIPKFAETSAMALRKVLQVYKADTKEDTDGRGMKGKGKEEESRAEQQNGANSTIDPAVKLNESSTAPIPANKILRKTSNSDILASNISASSVSISSTSIPTSTNTPNALHYPTEISSTSSLSISTTTQSQPFPFPPIIHKLLSSRLFRLAVFHLLSTPEYATDPSLIIALADHLEEKGAGKLSKRLKRGLDISNSTSEGISDGNNQNRKIRLYSDPKFDDRLPSNYWKIPLVPPTHPTKDPRFTQQDSLTEYYNSHLEYLLKSPSIYHSQYPISPIGSSRNLPKLSSNLNQLRKLLHKIDILEKHRGFKPDRKTCNLIIGCWLRSSIPPSSSSRRMEWGNDDNGYREYRDKDGVIRVVRKQPGKEVGLNRGELRNLFRVLSGIITSTRRSATQNIDNSLDSDKSPSTQNTLYESDSSFSTSVNMENQKEWEEVIRPFGKNMIRSMKSLGDTKGVELVKDWMKEQKKSLLGDEKDWL